MPPARPVLAFYYAWYDWDTWATPLCDEPQPLYVSADAAAVDRHLRQADSVGIDAFVQPWYGPSLFGNPTEPNLAMLLVQAAGHSVSVSAALDMRTGGYLATGEDVVVALNYLSEQHANKVSYFRVNGRPVVFFLGQDALSLPSWEAVRNRADPGRSMIWIAEASDETALEVFDGIYVYDVADGALSPLKLSDWGNRVRGWETAGKGDRFWVASVLPGYDDSYVLGDGDEVATIRSRDDGDTYQDSWAAASDSAPDWFLIRSYNGWRNCTHIEPSENHGDTYLDFTAAAIQAYRQPATPSPTPTASPTFTATAMVTPTNVPATTVPTETPVPTATVTPTVTMTPSATPFRLATPTVTAVPVGAVPPVPATGRPAPSTPVTSAPSARPGGPTPTPTLMPRLPVEGDSPRTCSLMPLCLMATVALIGRRRTRAQ